MILSPHRPFQRKALAFYRLGNRLKALRRNQEAAEAYHHALALEPGMAAAWHNLGHLLQIQQDYRGASSCYQRALLHAPDDPDILNNIGVLYRETGRNNESRAILEQLIARCPEDGDAHWNLSLTLLQAGDFARGWQEYEWRFRRSQPVRLSPPQSPRWRGEPPDGATILLCCEQAYGDMIQFARFIPLLADRGARVLLQCPDSAIAGLLAGIPGVAETVLTGTPPPAHDCWAPLLSLPLHLQAGPDTLPPPYLHAQPARLSAWSDIRSQTGKLRVGLVWSGRSTDPRRACPAGALGRLAGLRELVQFHSLQLNPSEGDLTTLREQLGIIDLAPQLGDFCDTAAALMSLDMLISIDSAPAHLAGALGVETLLMLSSAPDWRWGAVQEQSVWYPSVRLFRQQQPGDWDTLLEQVAAAVQDAAPALSSRRSANRTDELLAAGDRFREREAWSAALWAYEQAALCDPGNVQAVLCSGGCLLFLRRPHEAAARFRTAITLQPDLAEAHINLGLACLAAGELREGWQEFEWRRHNISTALPPWPELPAITAGCDLSGRSVLVHAEQGFGDLFQFARYLPLLANTGIRIIITVPASVVALFSRIKGVAQAVPHGELLPKTDYQTLLLSLPLLLQKTYPDIPRPVSYLEADPALTAEWRQGFAHRAGLKVGLVWSGREMHRSGYRRSLAPEQLARFSGLPGITFYSLQMNPPPDLQQVIPGIVELGSHIRNFDDTAAIIANLDLLITVDTSVAHLAGAMGRPAWVALLFAADWRWNSGSQGTTPWYDSLHLFRQPSPGAWEPVLERMAVLLEGEALIRTGHALGMAGQRGEAIATFRRAAELPEKSSAAFLNLGIYLRADGQPDQAADALLKAAELDPGYPEAWQNLALALQDLGRVQEAGQCFKQALALRPDYPTARWNLGLLQLLMGDYREGFRNFEHRFSKVGAVARLHTGIPAWDGSSSPAGRTMLVHAEQGYGDTLQFVRFLQPLADSGATVILEVQDRSLADLCRTVPGVAQVIVRGEPLPRVDYQIPLLSLPFLFKCTLDSIPRKVPYLCADKNRVNAWQERLPRDGRPRVGICWKGRPVPDPRRSVPFAEIIPLLDLTDICWISLQIDQDADAVLPAHLLDVTAGIGDFSDSAALISCLDLVITIDSAVAHLAGALGRPGIVLLPFAPDWRWTRDQSATPWYPTLTLTRQHQPNDWASTIADLKNSPPKFLKS